jgi:tetratricopeptide (TPR) repeat protein
MEEAEELLRQAIRISIETDNRMSEGVALCTMGILRRRMGQEEKALEWYEQALEIQEELGDRWQISIIQGNMAIAHAVLGHTDEALECLLKAKKLGRETGNRMFEAIQTANMAEFLMTADRDTEATGPMNEAALLFREIGNRRAEAVTLMNLGTAWRRAGNHLQSEKCYLQALDVCREMEDPALESDVLETLASLMAETDRLPDAWGLLESARERAQGVNDGSVHARIACGEGVLCLRGGNSERARELYREALGAVDSHGIGEDDVTGLRTLRNSLLDAGTAPDAVPLPSGWPEEPDSSGRMALRIYRLQV